MVKLERLLLTLFSTMLISKPTLGDIQYPEGYEQILDLPQYDRHTDNGCDEHFPNDRCAEEENLDNRYLCTTPLSVGEHTILETGYTLYFNSVVPSTETTPATAHFHLYLQTSRGIINAAILNVSAEETEIIVGSAYSIMYKTYRGDCHTEHLINLAGISGRVALELE